MVIGMEEGEGTELTAQAPGERLQVAAGEKLATPLVVHVIVPPGESPETLAVHVVIEPVAAGDGVH